MDLLLSRNSIQQILYRGVETCLPAGRNGNFVDMNKYFVYILLSLDHAHNYVGKTGDLKRRLDEHNRGAQISTRAYGPWKIIYTEEFISEELARDKEKYLKTGSGREFKKKIIENYIAG